MPILINVSELKPGMALASHVVNQYSVLLPYGRRLNDADITRLVEKFPEMTVQVVDPILDEAVEFDDDRHDHEVSLEVRRNVASVTQKVSSQVRTGVALNATHVAGVENVVDNMVDYLSQNPVAMAVISRSSGWDEYLQEHTANVFYLSLLIGNTIRNYIGQERKRLTVASTVRNAMNVTPLATAAMFHDIAMAPLSDITRKTEPLTPEDIAAIRAHPTAGAEMLPDGVDPMARLVVRCHHENFDGTGYPQGLQGPDTNIFARIIRVADAYTAGTANKVYRKAQSPVGVMHSMLHSPLRNAYDPVVLKVFSSIVQPLSIGAKLTLSDGRCAVVVRHDRQDCFNPLVVIAFDEFGDPVGKDDLEPPFGLRDRDDIQVATFGDEDVSFINSLEDEQPLKNSQEQQPDPKDTDELGLDSTLEPFDLAFP